MTKKREKEYQDDIRALNFLILEMKDQVNAIGSERDYWKGLATKMLEMAGYQVPETDGPLLRDDDGKLIPFESVKEDFRKVLNRSKKNDE